MMHNAMSQWPKFPKDKGAFYGFLSEADEAAFTITAVSSGTADVVSTVAGGALVISGAATTDNSGASVQANEANMIVDEGQVLRFLTKVRVSDATEIDLFAGFYETDTDPVGGLANGIYFTKADGSTRLKLVHEKATVETVLDTGIDLAANTDYELAFEVTKGAYNGSTYNGKVVGYVDGKAFNLDVEDILANTVLMRPSLFAQSGTATGTITATFKGVGYAMGTFN